VAFLSQPDWRGYAILARNTEAKMELFLILIVGWCICKAIEDR